MAKNVVKTLLTAQDKTGPAFKSATSNMTKLKTASAGLAKVLAPLAAAASVGAIIAIGKNSLDSADKIAKLSDSIGVSTEALSQYQHVAELSGTSFETMATAMKKMQKNVSDAADGLSTAKRAFAGLGLSIERIQGMKPEEAFELIGDELSRIDDRARRNQIAMNIFGRAGADLIPVFKDGAAGISAMRAEADKLGLTLTSGMAQDAANAKDSMQRLDAAFSGMAQTLAIEAAPALESFADAVVPVIGKIGGFIRTVDDLVETAANSDYAIWATAQQTKALADEMGLASLATLEFKDSLNGITDVGDVFQFGNQIPKFDASESGFLKDNSFPASWEHDRLMQTIEDFNFIDNFWAGLPTTMEKVDLAALNSRIALSGLHDAADRTGNMIAISGEQGADRMADALADAVAQGKLQLEDLGRVASSIFGEIFSGFLKLGINALFAGATGGASFGLPFVGSIPVPSIGGTVNPLAGVSSAGGGIVVQGGLNVTIPQAVNMDDPMARREIAKGIYDDLQVVAKQHGPED